MPCFKGLAVSIHTPDGPLAEHSIQKQTRASRISSYIPVPPAKVPPGSVTGKPEQSTFAISITLLTPGLNVPYSTPKPTEDDPFPRPRVVGGLPGYTGERGRYGSVIPPYVPRTTNADETIAAYIYFDGRLKEEVATLLRRGEETWVNSRWVSVPESEGGGLAEREFLFREVGLERWLNGLDLEGSKNKAEMIERRQRRLEKKRRKRKEQMGLSSDGEQDDNSTRRADTNGVLRYGGENGTPVEDIVNDEGLFSSDSDSEDEPPQAEAAGQIKVALFRVLASGEIKRGEYSPQFDAHDDDETTEQNGAVNGEGGDADVDHTTSFAKPKTLDPKSISTQTVTGLDPPESPYAVFTFFYRGEKQLQKMGILSQPEAQKTPLTSKRKPSGPDFSKLEPLKSQGTVGFSGYRESAYGQRKSKVKGVDAMDSDADDDDDEELLLDTNEDVEVKQEDDGSLSSEDARRQGELAEGVQKIKLKRQHSAEPLFGPSATRKSPYAKTSDESPSAGTPQSTNSTSANAGTPPGGMSPGAIESLDAIGSPFKRHRASIPGLNNNIFGPLGSNTNDTFPHSSTSTPQTEGEQYRSAADLKQAVKVESDEEFKSPPASSEVPLSIRTRKLRGQPTKIYSCAAPPSGRSTPSKRGRLDSGTLEYSETVQASPTFAAASRRQFYNGSSSSRGASLSSKHRLVELRPSTTSTCAGPRLTNSSIVADTAVSAFDAICLGSGRGRSRPGKANASASGDFSLHEDTEIERQYGAANETSMYAGHRISSSSIRYSPL